MLRALSFCILPFVIRCSAQSNATNVTTSSVKQAFTAAHIVPDILSSFNPTSILDVVFTDNSTNTTVAVTPGVNLTQQQTLLEPQFFLTSNDTSLRNGTFVIALVDPDAPSPQNTSLSQFRHLLAGNFHVNGSSLNHTLLTNSSAALTDYVNPTPPVGSDPHRYTILLFVQPSNFESAGAALVNASTPRQNFNLTTFGNAVHLGNPIAGTFFLTKADNTTTNSTSTTSSAGTSATAPGPSSSAAPGSPSPNPSPGSASTSSASAPFAPGGVSVAVMLAVGFFSVLVPHCLRLAY